MIEIFSGKVSHFGGPEDTGVAPDEGLAFHYEVNETNSELFLAEQPEGTTGLARRLDPGVYYVACRWDYAITPKEMLATDQPALVWAQRTKKHFLARPADWGPHEDTGRAADISPGLMAALDIATDDEVVIIYPAPSEPKKRRPRDANRKPGAARRHVQRGSGKKHARNTKVSRPRVRRKR